MVTVGATWRGHAESTSKILSVRRHGPGRHGNIVLTVPKPPGMLAAPARHDDIRRGRPAQDSKPAIALGTLQRQPAPNHPTLPSHTGRTLHPTTNREYRSVLERLWLAAKLGPVDAGVGPGLPHTDGLSSLPSGRGPANGPHAVPAPDNQIALGRSCATRQGRPRGAPRRRRPDLARSACSAASIPLLDEERPGPIAPVVPVPSTPLRGIVQPLAAV